MFLIVTGLPGSSKTSHVLAKYLNVSDRPVYYRGIPLTEEGQQKLGWNELTDDQARCWHEHVPDGALVILDEAQELFPVRHASKPVPTGLSALETHRHHGWDVVFISQAPSLLDVHARTICNQHYHYERPFNLPYANEYHCGAGFVSPANRSELTSRTNMKRVKLPKQVWPLYRSAVVHTHKAKPPLKVILLIVIPLIVVPIAFYKFFTGLSIGNSQDAETVETQGSPVMAPASLPPGQSAGTPYRIEWGSAFSPDVKGLPFTAPIYREQAMNPKSVPVVHGCMSMRSDFSDCKCYTQQGTRITDMPWQMCVRALKDGIFNHLASSSPADSGEGERRAPPQSAGDSSQIDL